MRCTIPEISWHNREPVLSVDIHPVSKDFYRLASGGGDGHILIWQMSVCENGAVKQEVVTDLSRHQKAVNAVRWSPSGQYLASADDDAYIIVWQLKTDNIPLLEGESEDKEVWIVYKVLRGHKEDIYDICWSVDNTKLLSGSVDNTAILWDLNKGKVEHILADHKGFVQGVAWDPKGQFLATVSTDRICRLFDISGKHVKARIHKGKLPLPPHHFLFDKESKFFHDDTFKSFFRRLEFSPDGSLLVVPSGHIQAEDCKKSLNATLVFTMDNFNEPAAVLPLPAQTSTAVRFCPTAFELRRPGPQPYVRLPYRLVFAVGAGRDVALYDTQQAAPFALLHELHYTRPTDLAWAADGRVLVAASTDGFCALVTFERGELGEPYVKEDSDAEESSMDTSTVAETADKDENIDINNKLQKEAAAEKKRASFLEQWAQNTPKKTKSAPEKKPVLPADGEVVEIIDDEDVKELPSDPKEQINRLIPRRIKPTAVEKGVDGGKATPIEDSNVKESPMNTSAVTETANKDDNVNTNKLQKEATAEKKRTSFLKQWAQNTPKKTKSAPEKKPVLPTDGEVVEIVDDEDVKEMPSDPKEHINRLIPRRIKPTAVEKGVDVTKKALIKDSSDAEESPMDTSAIAETADKDNVDKKLQKEAAAEKKRASFLEQWAQNTPKKTKSAPEKKPVLPADGEVVEIIDDEDVKEMPSDPKEQINRLIPRRIKPTTLREGVDVTKKMPTKVDSCAEKSSMDTSAVVEN